MAKIHTRLRAPSEISLTDLSLVLHDRVEQRVSIPGLSALIVSLHPFLFSFFFFFFFIHSPPYLLMKEQFMRY